MSWIIENWGIIAAIIVAGSALGYIVYKMAGIPTIKQWLVYAVIQTEKALGTGTGALKLRTVYNLFITRFPVVSRFVTFDTFSLWVNEALKEMEKLLSASPTLTTYVTGKEVGVEPATVNLTLDANIADAVAKAVQTATTTSNS